MTAKAFVIVCDVGDLNDVLTQLNGNAKPSSNGAAPKPLVKAAPSSGGGACREGL